jgi:anti-sigma factor RsiW
MNMIASQHVDDAISDFIEGALDQDAHRRFHRHLVRCQRCRRPDAAKHLL